MGTPRHAQTIKRIQSLTVNMGSYLQAIDDSPYTTNIRDRLYSLIIGAKMLESHLGALQHSPEESPPTSLETLLDGWHEIEPMCKAVKPEKTLVVIDA